MTTLKKARVTANSYQCNVKINKEWEKQFSVVKREMAKLNKMEMYSIQMGK